MVVRVTLYRACLACVSRSKIVVHFLTGERLRLLETFSHAPQLLLERLGGLVNFMLLN